MKTKTLLEWVSGESPETEAIKLISVIESDGTRRTITGYMAGGIWYQIGQTDPLIESGVTVMAWASFPTFEGEAEPPRLQEGQGGEHPTNVQKLIALHEDLLQENPYSYFELARTRTTDWMAILATTAVDNHHDYRILAKGQGMTPEEAAQSALQEYANRKG